MQIQKLEDEVRTLAEKKITLTNEIQKFETVRTEIQDKILKYKSEEETLSESSKLKQKLIIAKWC